MSAFLAKCAALAAAACLLIVPAAAEEAAAFGPAVGAASPHDLAARDSEGAEVSFTEIAGEKGLAVYFVRSADWCPICQRQLIALNERVPEFNERGYNVVSVSYDEVKKLSQFKAQRGVDFVMLSDPNSEIIDAFNARDPQYGEGSFAEGVPFPLTVLISSDGVVTASLYNVEGYQTDRGYVQRVETDDVLAAIDGENGS